MNNNDIEVKVGNVFEYFYFIRHGINDINTKAQILSQIHVMQMVANLKVKIKRIGGLKNMNVDVNKLQ